MILAIKWGKQIGNENRVISENDIDRYVAMGYQIYKADYRPGLYIERKHFEKSNKRIA